MGDGILRGCGKADLGMDPAMFGDAAQHHVPQVCGSGCVARPNDLPVTFTAR